MSNFFKFNLKSFDLGLFIEKVKSLNLKFRVTYYLHLLVQNGNKFYTVIPFIIVSGKSEDRILKKLYKRLYNDISFYTSYNPNLDSGVFSIYISNKCYSKEFMNRIGK